MTGRDRAQADAVWCAQQSSSRRTTSKKVAPGNPLSLRSSSQGGNMFRDLGTLTGSRVIATDGEIGKVTDFLFDDQSWTIAHLVVDVRNWLIRRDVVLAVAAVKEPDWSKKVFRIQLTREQVRDSPVVDSAEPVSRQQEIAMAEYFGRLACWVDRQAGASSIPTGTEYPLHSKANPHLRSVWHLTGYKVWSAGAEIGRLEGFVVDEPAWHIGYINAKAGDWPASRFVLIPTHSVQSISWADRRVKLHRSR